MKRILILTLFGLSMTLCAQTTPSVDATLTISPALQTATVAVTPANLTVQVGQAVNYTVSLTGPAGIAAPTGTITLLASPHGTNTYQAVATYTLNGHPVTCTYTAPNAVGSYDVHVSYSGDTNYNPRP